MATKKAADTEKKNDPKNTVNPDSGAGAGSGSGENADVKFLNVTGDIDDLNTDMDEILGTGDPEAAADQSNMGKVTEDMAAQILATPFSVAAAFMGSHWKLSKEELELMSPPAARVFTQLFGQYCSKYPDAYMLGFALCASIGTRVAMTVSDRKKEKEQPKIASGNERGFVAVPDKNNMAQGTGQKLPEMTQIIGAN